MPNATDCRIVVNGMDIPPQDALNETYNHYVVDGMEFGYGQTGCEYRVSDNHTAKCAVGHLMEVAKVPEDSPDWNDSGSVDGFPLNKGMFAGTNERGMDFLQDLQGAHDGAAQQDGGASVPKLIENLCGVAESWNLAEPTPPLR